jgi:hypothetical protein
MSLLSDFVAAVAPQAKTIIGAESITVAGGQAVAAILNEVGSGSAFGDVGFDADTALTALVSRADWIAAGYSATGSTYLKKTATALSQTFRVDHIDIGAHFVKLSLSEPTRA